jgi:hypothetical protein
MQHFVDPRATKIRKNFQVVSSNLDVIRGVDPELHSLRKLAVKTGNLDMVNMLQNAKNMTNSDVLNEILQMGKKDYDSPNIMKRRNSADELLGKDSRPTTVTKKREFSSKPYKKVEKMNGEEFIE